jgi:hypothetical protein
MKKICIVFLLSLAITVASAQDYKKFKVGLGIAITAPQPIGPLITFEAAYRVSDNLAIGLRIDDWVYSSYNFYGDGGGFRVMFGSFSLNGQYYLSANKFRPFVGGGVGMFNVYERTITDRGHPYLHDFQRKFGFYPRVGFDAGHFSLSLDYNFIQASTVTHPTGYYSVTGVPFYTTYEVKQGYASLRIGLFFGGGKK